MLLNFIYKINHQQYSEYMEQEKQPIKIHIGVDRLMERLRDGVVSTEEAYEILRARQWAPDIDLTDETPEQAERRLGLEPLRKHPVLIDHALERGDISEDTYRTLYSAIHESILERQQSNVPFTVRELMDWVQTGQITIPQALRQIKSVPRIHIPREIHYDAIDPASDDDVEWVFVAHLLDAMTDDEFIQLYTAVVETYNM